MILGLDFGTTNSGAAVFDRHSLRPLPLDPTNQNPTVCRTAMYFTRDGHYYFGREAITRYFQQNLGRRTKLNRVWVGEIMQVFAELPTFYRDVYVYEDVFSPGRIFLSIKTSLRNRGYFGTTFRDQWYSPSDLVATFLMGMRSRIKATLEQPVNEVVIGRPVHFSDDPTEDETAQKRLLHAAFKAGFERVYLEYEPVAAARFYEQRLRNKKEIVLVFDFGGGTLDFTIMEMGLPSARRILATGGIPIAGDVFDQRLFRESIPKHLGEGSQLVSGHTVPPHIFEALSDWQEVLGLNTPENLHMLDDIKREAVEQDKIEALIKVITSNYALLLFDHVEKAKVRLSFQPETTLSIKLDELNIEDKLTRQRFEWVIGQEYRAIRERLHETIARSGLTPRQIDRVIRTGGSSQIPLFVRLLEQVFGPEKVLAINTFGSVTSGLAIIGHEIASGNVDYVAYTPDSVQDLESVTEVKTHRGVKQRVDLGDVRRHLEIAQQVMADPAELPYHVLLAIDGEGKLAITDADETVFADAPADERRVWIDDNSLGIRSALLTSTGEAQVLLATDMFKLILTPAKSILIASRFGAKGLDDLLRLEPGESLTAMALWNPARTNRRFVCAITRQAHIRRFESDLLAMQLSQAPYFKLEKKRQSAPAHLVQANGEDQLILGTSLGRLTRVPVSALGIEIYRGFKSQKGEEVTAATSASPASALVAVDRRGHVFHFQCDTVPAALAESKKSQTLKRGVGIVGVASHAELTEKRAYALTAHGWVAALALPSARKPPKLASTPHAALPLAENDQVVALLRCDAPFGDVRSSGGGI